jgi:hypothetical protein
MNNSWEVFQKVPWRYQTSDISLKNTAEDKFAKSGRKRFLPTVFVDAATPRQNDSCPCACHPSSQERGRQLLSIFRHLAL